MDHVDWRIIDAKRKEKDLPPVAATGKAGLDPLGTEGFDIRQPQHIPLAANLGLGIFDFKTDQTKPGQAVIDHRIVSSLIRKTVSHREPAGELPRSDRRPGLKAFRDEVHSGEALS